MQEKKFKHATSTLTFALVLAAGLVGAQSQDYIVPRTPDGQPDLQGLWTNDTITPMERPASLQGRAFLSEDEIYNLTIARGTLTAEERKVINDHIKHEQY